ncbi:sigma 54-interacting transcriptional regulator [Polyangium aurulentum]|uniref:sigma 54-interacting transcriptional regulator n=1 Tax=Polyangium aurulentum TaxID=2567896 RepID=UPI0010AE5D19|nr:sigma 54-interacting transcriptional regulator [Polyangium aurulentum]UQA58239.1 sigma 54-interacting transcriptional regulator [Polyangium aurulentum]
MRAPEVSSRLAERRFEIVAAAGRGGAGEVFRARTGALEVALKIARDEGARTALAREAMHAALALSPRLPELVDVGWLRIEGQTAIAVEPGERDGACSAFVALRWVEGTVLRAAAAGDPATRVARALRIARDVGEALSDLHEVGLAHGDLKPENVVVGADGRAHVIDLGLACVMHALSIEGATPRYLARGDADLGDARARDMVALGALLAEIAAPEIAEADHPIAAARAARLPSPLDAICSALLTPSPGARPSAAWVAETARAALAATGGAAAAKTERAERDARKVRAAYLRARRDEIAEAQGAREDTAPWLGEALAWARQARSIEGDREDPKERALVLEPLGPDGIARWLTALVGSPAAAWTMAPLAGVAETTLARALGDLGRRLPPAAWTFVDVEAAALGRPRETPVRSSSRAEEGSLGAEEVARLALSIAAVPPDPLAIERVEQRADAPAALVVAAADALRLSGELGRARSLVLRDGAREAQGAEALAAEILRRAGDLAAARTRAEAALGEGRDPDGRARAVLARIAYDERRLDDANALVQDATSGPASEVAALVAAARGETARAMTAIGRGEVLARTAEERARFAALRGYVEHGADPARTRAAFAAAVDHAARAGAVVEEATYRTGEAAAAVDLGDIGGAIATARRAALLWEHLGRPALAARALLACAAAYATAGARHEAEGAARSAIARAREGGDTRAEAYARWAVADVAPAGSDEGLRAAEEANALLAGAGGDDALRAAARIARHAPGALSDRHEELDRAADAPGAAAGARLDWWRARAEGILAGQAPEADERATERVLSAMVSLADARAPIASRGPALGAGHALAARIGRGDTALRLLSSLGDAARDLLARAPAELLASIRALPWVAQAALAAPEAGLRAEQARELETLVVSLSERERLRPLLDRVVDALVLWTGVERGLLLLRAPDGRLVPRAARNLARADLRGEQLALSQTLARRALEALEPVVAVDAAGELPAAAQSVHALKLRSVLVVPLIARGEALGVVYLDDRVRRGAFGPRELAWTRTAATLAALAITDARDQVLLRRAVRKAGRAKAALEETLAQREAALDAAERELNRTRSARATRFEYENIAGESEPIRAMLKIVDRVTDADVPVLLHGESGSGKELIARAVHTNGPRSGRPFVSENCGAIPEGLLESTLFGHVRGAFTGADRPRSGLFEAADRGTLFLDEIGEMSLPMQAKLLRVLEDGMVRPLGTERARKVDVRIIAATHRDLEAMVKTRAFREDLFYRLNIITIRIPPLRDRASDIPLIVQRLLDKHGRTEVRVTRAAMERLMSYAWPGNVRQLENEVRRALVLCDGVIDREHLSPEIANVTPPVPVELGLKVRPRVDALEAQLVREALERTKGNQTQAAKLLGLSRFGLQKMMKRLGVQ